jgi:hypothetical protein
MSSAYTDDSSEQFSAGQEGADPAETVDTDAPQARGAAGDAFVDAAGRARFARESVALPGQPLVTEPQGPAAGFTGQVPAQPANSAYTFAGVQGSDDAAQADRAASNARIFRGDLYAEPEPDEGV